MATTYSISCGNDCKDCSHNADSEMPIGPKMPRIFDPSTIPNIGSCPSDVLHFRPCMGITGIYTNPATHLERQLKYDTMVIAIAGAVSASKPPQVAYGVFMGKEADTGSANQVTGYSPFMCSQTKERAEVMAVSSAVKQALASIEECEQLGPGNQITKVIIINSSGGWLSNAFNDTICDYLANGFPNTEIVPGVSDDDYRVCYFNIQKIENKGVSLQFWDVEKKDNSDAIELANKAANDTETIAKMHWQVREEMQMQYLMAFLRERGMASFA